MNADAYEWDGTCSRCTCAMHLLEGSDTPDCPEDALCFTCVEQELEKFRGALTKINAIRNSIIGSQTVSWSAHIYPLVAALDEAGITGASYEEARAEVRASIEHAQKAEKT